MSVNAPVELYAIQRRLTRDEYHRMGDAGLFADERVELLHGLVVTMSPQGHRHAYPIRKLTVILGAALAGRAELLVQLPVVAVDESEPEPDLAVVPPGEYLDEHPARAYLLVEVSSSSLRIDLDTKAALYALSGFPAYWVIDVEACELIAHEGPRPDGTWRTVVRYGRDAVLACPGFPDVAVALDAVIPPPA